MRKLPVAVLAVAAICLPATTALAIPDPVNPMSPVAVPDTTYREVQTINSGVLGSQLGTAIAASGNTMAVSDTAVGNVYVYQRTGSNLDWHQVATISGQVSDHFGAALALDGDTLVIGQPWAEVNTTKYAGSVVVYTGGGATWTKQATLSDPNPEVEGTFGRSVAISGNRIVVGAPESSIPPLTNYAGRAFVFTRSGGAWDAGTQLVPTWATADLYYGAGTAINGSTILVGAPGKDATSPLTGRVAVWTEYGGVWTQQADLPAPSGLVAGGLFGARIQMTATRALAIAANPLTYPASPVAYSYTGAGPTWTLDRANTATDPGPALAFLSNSFTILDDQIIAGFPAPELVSSGMVRIWGPEKPLNVPRNGLLKVEDPGVLVNDFALGMLAQAPVVAQVVTPPAHGQVWLQPSGMFGYQPSPGYVGTDSFTYSVTSAQFVIQGALSGAGNVPQTQAATSAPAKVTINVVPPTQYTLNYAAGANGSISGTTPQAVYEGDSGTPVTAVPAAGASFVRWSDGVTTATRQDKDVKANLSVTAQFSLPVPTKAKAVSGKSKFSLTVLAKDCTGPYSFTFEKRKVTAASTGSSDGSDAVVSWLPQKKVYKTSVKTNAKTVNLKKGTYRAVVTGRCNYTTATSTEVKLKK